jgi:cyclopropane fatty-acyl-phospholipid synthase-like methyltransferase
MVWNGYSELLDGIHIPSPSILELGSGSGFITAKLVQMFGGTATLVDFSQNALEKSKEIFARAQISEGQFIQKNIIDISYKNCFDIVHSEGVIEHFFAEDQNQVLQVHKQAANESGFIIILVPTPTWYYRLIKWYLNKVGKWRFGYEKALTQDELIDLVEKSKMRVLKTVKTGRIIGILAKKYAS